MSLPVFYSLDEKLKYFNVYKADSLDDFQRYIERFKPRKITKRFCTEERTEEIRYLFRGVDNSSYKMFSSLQRCLNDRIEKYNQKISLQSLMAEILNRFYRDDSGLMFEEYKRQMPEGTVSTQPSIWAFIQHFGGPSPLLDFTDSLESALFFAFSEGKFIKPYNAENQQPEYVSLFAFRKNPMTFGESTSQYANDAESATRMVEEYEKMSNVRVDTDAFVMQSLEQPLEQIAWGSMVYGGKKSNQLFRVPDAENSQVCSVVQNINISAQEGNFFQGSLVGMQPLEESNIVRYAYGKGEVNCIEIHRSVVGDIMANYKLPTKDDVYPEKNGRLKPLYDAMSRLWLPKGK